MGDSSITITNGLTGASRTFEANSQPLETTTMWINFDSSNDYSVPLRADDGTTVYLRPDQIDAIRMRGLGARDAELGEGGGSITIQSGGRSHTIDPHQLQVQLQNRGRLT